MTVDFERARIRSRIEARLLDAGAKQTHVRHGKRKQAVIGAMTGTIVEIGAGTGANMRYYADGVRVIAIEPNPAMHPRLRSQAERHGVDLEIRTLRGEGVDFDDGHADAVVGTLVLCGVDDPRQVLSEVHRVLKRGGTFFFHEHVVAPAGTWTRRVQRVLKRPHRWMFNGCEVDRDTARVLRNAGFDSIEIEEVDVGGDGLYFRHQIIGTATR